MLTELKAVVIKEAPGIVILGKQSIDGDNGQTGQMLAALLNWSQGTFASNLELDGDHINVCTSLYHDFFVGLNMPRGYHIKIFYVFILYIDIY